jgi:hypothetical protein
MIRLTEEVKQRWHKIDVTHRVRNSFARSLARQPNQEWNTCGFFEHCFFSEEMMGAQAVAVVARVHDNSIVSQTESFDAGEDGTNALIHQRNQAEITLLNTPIFLRSDAKKQLSGQPLSIQNRFRLLPFPHQPITQRNVFALRTRGRRIELNLIERMFIVERTVVRRVRLYKTNNENERIALMFFDEFACAFLEELWT